MYAYMYVLMAIYAHRKRDMTCLHISECIDIIHQDEVLAYHGLLLTVLTVSRKGYA